MTSISGNSAALSILTQASTLPAGNKSAADNILDIVSGGSTGATDKAEEARLAKLAAQKAKIAALDQPREAGGTVSSEISAGWTSATSQIVESVVYKPPAATLQHAEIFTGLLLHAIADYNGKFNQQIIPSREEVAGMKDAWLAEQYARGSSDKVIKAGLEWNFGEGGYERNVASMINQNAAKVSISARAEDLLAATQDRIRETFGINVEVTYDDVGKASLKSFDINYANGQKMLSYTADGGVATYNSDGTDRRTLSNDQAAMMFHGYYL